MREKHRYVIIVIMEIISSCCYGSVTNIKTSCNCIQTETEAFSGWRCPKCFNTSGNIWSVCFFFLSGALKQNQTYIWISSDQTDTSLESGCRRSLWSLLAELRQGAQEPAALILAALKLMLTLHLNGGSEAPCSETPHLDGTTSEVDTTSPGVQDSPLGFTQQHLCVCLLDWCTFGLFCCWLCAHLSPRWSACIAAWLPACALPVTLTSQLSDSLFGLPPASLSISLPFHLPDRLVVFWPACLPSYLSVCVTASLPASFPVCWLVSHKIFLFLSLKTNIT